MSEFHSQFPQAGFIWLGFPEKEMPAAREYVNQWTPEEQDSLLLLGNLEHDAFLSLLTRCFAYIRTPACDGVSASVLESLALGIPVIASENGRRPRGVLTYKEQDAAGLCATMVYLMQHRAQVKTTQEDTASGDNVARMADWLAGTSASAQREEVAHVV
jgi:glycosyltransferase involved in cell wall biosynthesis